MGIPKSRFVYGTNDYGKDVFIDFGSLSSTDAIAVTIQSFTPSAAATEIIQTGTNMHVEHTDKALSITDSLGIAHLGDNTIFERIFEWTPDMNALVYKTSLQIAVGLNVSAFTTGSFNITRVRIGAVERNSGRILIPTLNFEGINTALTATGTLVMIIMDDYTDTFKVWSKNPIDITVTVTVATGTGTRQEGILPTFCWTKPNIIKPFSVSGVLFHIHASLDHAKQAADFDQELVSEWT